MATQAVSGLSLLSKLLSEPTQASNSNTAAYQTDEPAAIIDLSGSFQNPSGALVSASGDSTISAYAAFISSLEGGRRSVAQILAGASFSQQQHTELMYSDGTQGDQRLLFAQSVEADVQVSLDAELTLEDGTAISINAELAVHLSMSRRLEIQQHEQPQPPAQSDPLALDIDNDGAISLTDPGRGMFFDINADGRVDRTSFVRGNDVFLALDRNGNGRIDDGGELFGDQHGSVNGFLELARYDQDSNGVIDTNDSVFNSLKGVRMGPAATIETVSLPSLGVGSIGLDSQKTYQQLSGGNLATDAGSYTTVTGQKLRALDVLLRYQ